MPPLKKITYTHLLGSIYHQPRDIDNHEVLQLLKQVQSIPQHLLPFKGIIHLIDYTKRSHVALSGEAKNMIGYRPEDVIENGLDFVIDIFQKDDFNIYNENMFPKVIDFLRHTPQEEHSNYIFSYSYRMRKPDGKWANLFQQGSYVTDPKTKLPLYGTALVTDITPLKKDTSMIFSVDKKTEGSGGPLYGTNIITEYYFSDPEESRLSVREREILGRLAEGLSSKQIADKLFLSENTIVNHRKNMLKKTNTKNIAELVRYAINKGII
jgi:DNA-binding CsgD family transcriptional regulator